jgi:hypothetical protein
MCYLCLQTKVLPISPVVQKLGIDAFYKIFHITCIMSITVPSVVCLSFRLRPS